MHFSTLFTFCPVCGSSNFRLNNEKSKYCDDCNFVLYVNPSAAVGVFIVNDKNELLVCKRGKEPEKGTLDLPGGFVDCNESVEQAVEREVFEELNIHIKSSKYLFSIPNNYEYSGFTIPTIDMFYLSEVVDLSTLKAADDVEECFFIAMNELNPDFFGLNSIKKALAIFKNENSIA